MLPDYVVSAEKIFQPLWKPKITEERKVIWSTHNTQN